MVLMTFPQETLKTEANQQLATERYCAINIQMANYRPDGYCSTFPSVAHEGKFCGPPVSKLNIFPDNVCVLFVCCSFLLDCESRVVVDLFFCPAVGSSRNSISTAVISEHFGRLICIRFASGPGLTLRKRAAKSLPAGQPGCDLHHVKAFHHPAWPHPLWISHTHSPLLLTHSI